MWAYVRDEFCFRTKAKEGADKVHLYKEERE